MSTTFDPPPLNVDIYAIRRWTHANKRARNDYYAHPIASCSYALCPRMADAGPICGAHDRQLTQARDRMRRSA